MSDKPKYLITQWANKFRVIERESDTILRTVDTRSEAAAFIEALDPGVYKSR